MTLTWIELHKKPCKDCGVLVKYSSLRCHSCNTKFRMSQHNWLLDSQNKPTPHKGSNHYNWKGGLPKCIVCNESCGTKKNYKARFCLKHKHWQVTGSNHPRWVPKTFCTQCSKQLSKNYPIFKICLDCRKKNYLERDSTKYDSWRKAVFKRDNFTCQLCSTRGGILNADHIKPWALYPELRFDLDNGRTLCLPCHLKEPSSYLRGKEFVRFYG